ncbi:hypothetical protein BOX15_Mlig026061g1 [Macrostomum lignano]|uniref:Ig-like domain-containing protein n=2 Tax=Macrostomum lignano TaxID=282301 RepID=A0A267H9B5_9PLAT|nr:hypothetical protein BOX15_Mlig026061g1 [Macrostomum lignano]
MRQRLAQAVASLLLLTAAAASASRVNVTVDNVVVHLQKQADGGFGEAYKLDKRAPLVITCRAETSPPKPGQAAVSLAEASFDWRRPGRNRSISVKESRASIHTECKEGVSCISTLTLRSPINEDVSVYECLVTPVSADGAVMETTVASGAFQSRPIIRMLVNGNDRFDVAVWPTETVNITCQVLGHPLGDIRWSQQFRPSFNHSRNETLLLSQMDYELDRGTVTCESSNDFGANQATMFLRVKSPRAFLPPLLGIGAELVTMLVIIVSYEVITGRKRRQMDEQAAEATDGVQGAADGVNNDQ